MSKKIKLTALEMAEFKHMQYLYPKVSQALRALRLDENDEFKNLRNRFFNRKRIVNGTELQLIRLLTGKFEAEEMSK